MHQQEHNKLHNNNSFKPLCFKKSMWKLDWHFYCGERVQGNTERANELTMFLRNCAGFTHPMSPTLPIEFRKKEGLLILALKNISIRTMTRPRGWEYCEDKICSYVCKLDPVQISAALGKFDRVGLPLPYLPKLSSVPIILDTKLMETFPKKDNLPLSKLLPQISLFGNEFTNSPLNENYIPPETRRSLALTIELAHKVPINTYHGTWTMKYTLQDGTSGIADLSLHVRRIDGLSLNISLPPNFFYPSDIKPIQEAEQKALDFLLKEDK